MPAAHLGNCALPCTIRVTGPKDDDDDGGGAHYTIGHMETILVTSTGRG